VLAAVASLNFKQLQAGKLLFLTLLLLLLLLLLQSDDSSSDEESSEEEEKPAAANGAAKVNLNASVMCSMQLRCVSIAWQLCLLSFNCL
jgi:hypothetical protein